MFEYFIANRYTRSKHKINFITIISILSTLGITIGVAALIVVMSVFNGFGSIVKNIFVNLDPHIKIVLISETSIDFQESIREKLGDLENVNYVTPFVEGKAIFLSDNSYEILRVNGLFFETQNSDFGLRERIISGEFNLESNGSIESIILGRQMALKLNRLVGDTVLVTSFEQLENTLLDYSIPTTFKFVVSGIFSSNNAEYDNSYAFTNIKSAQNLLGYKEQISGYNLFLKNLEDAEKIKVELESYFSKEKVAIYTWYDIHKDLYDVMQIERWAAFLILCLIVAIAAFNILASLTMTIVEKRKDIGVMRTLGASRKSIQKIYLLQGIIIGIAGTVSGLIIGLLVCYLQLTYNFYPLDPMKFIIDALPIEIHISDIIVITCTSLILSLGAGIIPARNSVKITISEAIKWE